MKASKTNRQIEIISTITRKFLNSNLNFLVQKKIKNMQIFFCIIASIAIIGIII